MNMYQPCGADKLCCGKRLRIRYCFRLHLYFSIACLKIILNKTLKNKILKNIFLIVEK